MLKWRTFWTYSVGLAVAWALVFGIILITKPQAAPTLARVFAGFFIGWLSTTIARYVYSPATRWQVPDPAGNAIDARSKD